MKFAYGPARTRSRAADSAVARQGEGDKVMAGMEVNLFVADVDDFVLSETTRRLDLGDIAGILPDQRTGHR